MHEFDKCRFCAQYRGNAGGCVDAYCNGNHSSYVLDVNKILNKADELNISVTDVLNLIRECNPPRKKEYDDLRELWIYPDVGDIKGE